MNTAWQKFEQFFFHGVSMGTSPCSADMRGVVRSQEICNGDVSRNIRLDLLKAFLISLVVYGHVLQYHNPVGSNHLAFTLIYSFHMPAFVLVAGYVGFRKRLTAYSCLRKIKHLIIPFFSWFIVTMPLSPLRGDFFRGGGGVWSLVCTPCQGLWFFHALSAMIFLVYVIQRVSGGKLEMELLISALLILLFAGVVKMVPGVDFGLQKIAFLFPYFMLGYFMYNLNCFRLLIMNKKLLCIAMIVFAATLTLNALHYKYFGSATLSACAGAVSLVMLFENLNIDMTSPSIKLLVCLGQSTLGIYAVHQCFNQYLCHVPYVAGGCILSILLLFVSLLITRALQTSRVLSVVFLGR